MWKCYIKNKTKPQHPPWLQTSFVAHLQDLRQAAQRPWCHLLVCMRLWWGLNAPVCAEHQGTADPVQRSWEWMRQVCGRDCSHSPMGKQGGLSVFGSPGASTKWHDRKMALNHFPDKFGKASFCQAAGCTLPLTGELESLEDTADSQFILLIHPLAGRLWARTWLLD